MQALKLEAQLQATERAESSKSRKVLAGIKGSVYRTNAELQRTNKEISRWRLEENKSALLDSLSRYEYQVTYRRLRKERIPDTTEWIKQEPAFLHWSEGHALIPRTIWLSGRCKYESSQVTRLR